MRLIARTLIILTAALLVCGATYALASSGYAQTAFPARAGRGADGKSSPPEFTPGSANGTGGAEGGPNRPGGERGGPGGFGALEVLKNLGIVAVITVIVAPILGLIRRRTRSGGRDAALLDTPLGSE